MDIGIRDAGFHILAEIELDEHCCATLEANRQKDDAEVIQADIQNIDSQTLAKKFSLIELMKNTFQHAYDTATNFSRRAELIASTLRGEFRTRTQKPYRGNGLPSIFQQHQKGQIHSLRVPNKKRCHGFVRGRL